MTCQNWINAAIVIVLAVNLIIFGMIAADIQRISDQLEKGALSIAVPAPVTANATGGNVTISNGAGLPDAPRTVEQVAQHLGVTPDTVRDSYIPAWITAGFMSESDKHLNRWLIPPTFEPYRPK